MNRLNSTEYAGFFLYCRFPISEGSVFFHIFVFLSAVSHLIIYDCKTAHKVFAGTFKGTLVVFF